MTDSPGMRAPSVRDASDESSHDDGLPQRHARPPPRLRPCWHARGRVRPRIPDLCLAIEIRLTDRPRLWPRGRLRGRLPTRILPRANRARPIRVGECRCQRSLCSLVRIHRRWRRSSRLVKRRAVRTRPVAQRLPGIPHPRRDRERVRRTTRGNGRDFRCGHGPNWRSDPRRQTSSATGSFEGQTPLSLRKRPEESAGCGMAPRCSSVNSRPTSTTGLRRALRRPVPPQQRTDLSNSASSRMEPIGSRLSPTAFNSQSRRWRQASACSSGGGLCTLSPSRHAPRRDRA